MSFSGELPDSLRALLRGAAAFDGSPLGEVYAAQVARQVEVERLMLSLQALTGRPSAEIVAQVQQVHTSVTDAVASSPELTIDECWPSVLEAGVGAAKRGEDWRDACATRLALLNTAGMLRTIGIRSVEVEVAPGRTRIVPLTWKMLDGILRGGTSA